MVGNYNSIKISRKQKMISSNDFLKDFINSTVQNQNYICLNELIGPF